MKHFPTGRGQYVTFQLSNLYRDALISFMCERDYRNAVLNLLAVYDAFKIPDSNIPGVIDFKYIVVQLQLAQSADPNASHPTLNTVLTYDVFDG